MHLRIDPGRTRRSLRGSYATRNNPPAEGKDLKKSKPHIHVTQILLTTETEKLVDNVNLILDATDRARFAVGYFFLTGFTSIAKELAAPDRTSPPHR